MPIDLHSQIQKKKKVYILEKLNFTFNKLCIGSWEYHHR